jgi:hypothetical protein
MLSRPREPKWRDVAVILLSQCALWAFAAWVQGRWYAGHYNFVPYAIVGIGEVLILLLFGIRWIAGGITYLTQRK